MIMDNVAEKSDSDTGNDITFICNRKLWNDIQMVLGAYLADFKTDGTFLYSKDGNKGMGARVSVGTTYNSYIYGGNQVTFVVDRTLTREYPDKGYGICLNLSEDKTSGVPAIAKFSLTGSNFITNKILGVGGYNGGESGVVASNVAGSKLVMMALN